MISVDDIKYAVENRIGLPADKVTEADLRAAGMMTRVFLLPEKFDERVSYMAGVLVQIFGMDSPVEGDLRAVSGILCQALSYLVNSKSWRDGELHSFDLDELRRKVRRLGVSKEELDG